MTLTLTFHNWVSVSAPPERVYAYLADFTTTNEWDPRAQNAVRRTGDGGVGTQYSCDVRFLRRTTRMRYEVTSLTPSRQITWVGRNRAVRARDVIDLDEVVPGVTCVSYAAQFSYTSLPMPGTLLLALPLHRLCADARRGLQTTLDERFGRA